jgi:D-glycero-alpha-D-manno-heptose-7-phosphate kinase
MYGGVNAVHLEPGGIRRESISVCPDEIDQRFVLFYTGAPRRSGINNWEVFKQHIDGDKHVINNFSEISQIAQAMHRALAETQWDDVERLMRNEWERRRTNAPGITTRLIDNLITIAMRHGARAAKVCGAGGGGCVIVCIEPGARQQVETAIRENGGQPLDFSVARQGLAFHSAPELETAGV